MVISLVAVAAACVAALGVLFALVRQQAQARGLERLRLVSEQILAGMRGEAETTRAHLANTERALTAAIQAGSTDALSRAFADITRATGELRQDITKSLGELRDALGRSIADLRALLGEGLRELRETSEARLAEIRATVNEQLHAAVEKQMNESFARVIDQFAAVQKAMGDVQAVTAQIGDIKRLFSNVKTRGGWGEAQVRAMLDDILPAGSYETNARLREGSDDVVEFAVAMPMHGEARVWLPVDAKFPVEDYERLLAASEAGDAEAERVATRGLERRMRDEARKIAAKYINPPVTVEFAVLYVPTDGLYAEVARIPGLIDEIGRIHKVLVLGPSVFPALLRTIQLGHVTLALEQKADQIRGLLGATRTEMTRMDEVLERLARQAGTFTNTIDKARVRTRAVARKLKSVEACDPAEAGAMLELEEEALMAEHAEL